MEFWIATGSRIIEAAALIMAADSAQPAQIPYPAESAPVSLQAVGNASGTFVDLGMAGGEKVVTRSADGLFYLSAVVNGVVVRFLVDTGATIIVLTAADAARREARMREKLRERVVTEYRTEYERKANKELDEVGARRFGAPDVRRDS